MQLTESDADLPLDQDEFQNLMDATSFDGVQKIAVAVSGGGDSMALTLLLNEWCARRHIKLIALTVDHGLRSASGDEAEQVAHWMADLGVEHHILFWDGEKPNSNIQDEARNARYQLLGQWCVDHDITNLYVAHHQEDQAETFLLRLFRGSGVDGLCAMDHTAPLPVNGGLNVTLHRPLLTVAKKRLITLLKNSDQAWIEDPSNREDRYARIKIRGLLASSEIEGLTSERMTSTAGRMSRVRMLLDDLTDAAESEYVKYNNLGFAALDPQFATELHEEIALRLLSKCIKKVSGEHYAPRLTKLENLFETLQREDFSGQTLAGAMVFKDDLGQIITCREPSKVCDKIDITIPKQYMWDNRFLVECSAIDGKIVPLTSDRRLKLKELVPDVNERLKNYFTSAQIRDRIVPSLPCIITDEGEMVLWDHLLSILNRTDLDGFSADFKE